MLAGYSLAGPPSTIVEATVPGALGHHRCCPSRTPTAPSATIVVVQAGRRRDQPRPSTPPSSSSVFVHNLTTCLTAAIVVSTLQCHLRVHALAAAVLTCCCRARPSDLLDCGNRGCYVLLPLPPERLLPLVNKSSKFSLSPSHFPSPSLFFHRKSSPFVLPPSLCAKAEVQQLRKPALSSGMAGQRSLAEALLLVPQDQAAGRFVVEKGSAPGFLPEKVDEPRNAAPDEIHWVAEYHYAYLNLKKAPQLVELVDDRYEGANELSTRKGFTLIDEFPS
ncbi:hypothetical protein Taro_038129 [Colocasia esculenta]|uniref:Uncharacterized protein n=1 Tax=Colocasia esculenta TaxID=4460 RepID=A0A843WD19_COLES|nr:hypothetical protein [Colocasia esculenta]